MPKQHNKNNKNKNSGSIAKKNFINSKTSSGSAVRIRCADDMTRRPLAPDLNKVKLPKQITTQIHWFTADFTSTANLSASVVTENNNSIALSTLPGSFSSLVTQLFDQLAIYCVYARTSINATFGTTATLRYFTALDYDNTGNIGSVAAIQNYSTVVESSIVDTQERYFEPCNAPALYSGSGTLFGSFGQMRMWVDSASPGTPHYGHRCIVDVLLGGTGTLITEFSVVVCARNSV